mmetsp:Transcript_125576/g.355241  ORF Transcript_125576/g.355241 Transcript_125576/m.355241 type:complete len:212 (+) Transcript_125576:1070-1705(+)
MDFLVCTLLAHQLLYARVGGGQQWQVGVVVHLAQDEADAHAYADEAGEPPHDAREAEDGHGDHRRAQPRHPLQQGLPPGAEVPVGGERQEEDHLQGRRAPQYEGGVAACAHHVDEKVAARAEPLVPVVRGRAVRAVDVAGQPAVAAGAAAVGVAAPGRGEGVQGPGGRVAAVPHAHVLHGHLLLRLQGPESLGALVIHAGAEVIAALPNVA